MKVWHATRPAAAHAPMRAVCEDSTHRSGAWINAAPRLVGLPRVKADHGSAWRCDMPVLAVALLRFRAGESALSFYLSTKSV